MIFNKEESLPERIFLKTYGFDQLSFIIQRMDGRQESKAYRPELIPRRGEAIAWLGTLIVAIAIAILVLTGNRISFWLLILGVPLALVSFGISLGNWMDRHTMMQLRAQGVSYTNGLRRVEFGWHEIRELRVLPAQWGKKVQVFGEAAYFGFHTLGEVTAGGRSLGRTGFKEGEQILQTILDKADLRLVQQVEVGDKKEGHYYARQ